METASLKSVSFVTLCSTGVSGNYGGMRKTGALGWHYPVWEVKKM